MTDTLNPGLRRETTKAPRRATLVFDGRCGVCTRFVRVMKRLDWKQRVTAVPYQKPGVPASVGLTAEACKKAAWAVTPEGHRYRGAEAVNLVLAVALGTSFPHALYRLPLMGSAQDRAYDWIAANRHKLPGDEPHCSRHPGECA